MPTKTKSISSQFITRHLALCLLLVSSSLIQGCAVVSATAGAAISITGAVVSTGIKVTGAVIEAAVGDDDEDENDKVDD